MNIDLITSWFKQLRWRLSPPGCFTDYLESPIDNQRLCVQVGLVNEHRFAYFYWAKFYQEYIRTRKYNFPESPILISLDYHNDVGADADCDPDVLKELNLDDETELSLFCWTYLNPLNDGQILPSLYLNFFSDVFILNTKKLMATDRTYEDRYSNIHNIYYFHDLEAFVNRIASLDLPFFLDIDLDYFTYYPDNEKKLGSSEIVNPKLIHDTLNLNNPLMSIIFPKLVGLTIALEPEHCGGYNNSMKIFDILNQEFFDNTLLTESSKWNIKNSSS